MSILDLHGDDMLAAASRYVKPVLPEPSFNFGALASAVPRGAAEAVLQVSASATELAQAPVRRTELDSPDGAMSNRFSDVFREAGRDMRPDPQTSHVAEQVLYQFARGATKIVGGALAAGPLGVVAAGIEEANSQADDLKREGVDFRTRTTAGAVQGAGLALAAIPAAGVTLRATAGLYLAGGPGGFVAQQALTREVLKGAGYDKLAEQYDPFDPVGLAVAGLVPLPFAAVGMRNARAAQAARDAEALRTAPMPSEPTAVASAAREVFAPEVVDAARVAYAVERRAASNPAPDVPRAADAHETAVARAETAMSRGEPVQVADLITPEMRAGNFRAWFGDSVVRTEAGEPLVVYHGSMVDIEAFKTSGLGSHFTGDPAVASQFGEAGNVLAVHLSIKNPLRIKDHGGHHDNADGVAKALIEAGKLPADYMDDAFYSRLMADGALGNSEKFIANNVAEIERMKAALEAQGYDGIVYRNTAEGGGDSYIAFDPRQIKSAIGNSGRFDPASPSLTDPVVSLADALAQIRQAMNPEPPRAPTTPQAPNPEAAAPARGVGPAAAEPTVPQPGSAPAAEAAGIAARLAQIEAEFPDLMVRMDGDDAARPLSDFLAAAKAEADEIAADAPLVQTLAECSLLNGTA